MADSGAAASQAQPASSSSWGPVPGAPEDAAKAEVRTPYDRTVVLSLLNRGGATGCAAHVTEGDQWG